MGNEKNKQEEKHVWNVWYLCEYRKWENVCRGLYKYDERRELEETIKATRSDAIEYTKKLLEERLIAYLGSRNRELIRCTSPGHSNYIIHHQDYNYPNYELEKIKIKTIRNRQKVMKE